MDGLINYLYLTCNMTQGSNRVEPHPREEIAATWQKFERGEGLASPQS